MRDIHPRRAPARALCLLLALCLLACALPALSWAAPAPEDRYDQVFDVAGDAGFLTARFVWLGAFDDDSSAGDCTILTSPEGKVMVIDAGKPASLAYVTDALDKMGVTRIDYLVASHPHVDHIGNFAALMQRYEIGAVYTSAVTYVTSSHYLRYMAAIQEHGLEHVILADGDRFAFGDQVTAEVLWPAREIPYYAGYPGGTMRTAFINNQSLVLKLSYGEGVMLFSGDLYILGERHVLAAHADDLQCDVAKINHHGSGTSSSKAWSDATAPRLAVAVSDSNPDWIVLRKYAKLGQTLQTPLDGCVRVRLGADDSLDILTQKERTTDLFD